MDHTMSINGRRTARALAGLALVVLGVATFGARAEASSVTVPAGVPQVVANAPLEVVVAGFEPNQNVFVEQCDGVSPTATGWDPTINCDLGSSPPPAIADANGDATFPSDDVNRAFHPFQGESPQSLFNCMAAGKPAPNNQLPTFNNCKLRISSNNSSATGDQVFVPIVLTGRSVPVPVRPGAGSSTTTVPGNAGTASPTTTTPARAKAAARRSGKGAAGRKPSPAEAKAAGAGVAVVTVPPDTTGASSGAGLLAVSDSGVQTGYLLLLLGLLIVFVPLLVRRRARSPVAPSGVTDAQPADEGT
jgi:hypothetical protein